MQILFVFCLTIVIKEFGFSFWLSVLHISDQQVAAYLETANQDSVILILWYQDHDYPILEVFEKQTQDLREQFYAKIGIKKSGWFCCGLEV